MSTSVFVVVALVVLAVVQWLHESTGNLNRTKLERRNSGLIALITWWWSQFPSKLAQKVGSNTLWSLEPWCDWDRYDWYFGGDSSLPHLHHRVSILDIDGSNSNKDSYNNTPVADRTTKGNSHRITVVSNVSGAFDYSLIDSRYESYHRTSVGAVPLMKLGGCHDYFPAATQRFEDIPAIESGIGWYPGQDRECGSDLAVLHEP